MATLDQKLRYIGEMLKDTKTLHIKELLTDDDAYNDVCAAIGSISDAADALKLKKQNTGA